MSVKAGDTAVVKSTGEPVFVLKVGPPRTAPEHSDMCICDACMSPEIFDLGAVADIRRYRDTDTSQGYVVDRLYVVELETPRERLQKDYDSFSDLVPAGKAVELVPVDTKPENIN